MEKWLHSDVEEKKYGWELICMKLFNKTRGLFVNDVLLLDGASESRIFF